VEARAAKVLQHQEATRAKALERAEAERAFLCVQQQLERANRALRRASHQSLDSIPAEMVVGR
jgi:hypothetical protein